MDRVLLGALSVGGPICFAMLVPRPAQAWAALTGPVPPHDPTAPLLALIALAVWALALWLATGVVLVAAGRLPGAAGRVAAALAARTVPAAVRRAIGVAVGTSLALGGVGATPAGATALDGPRAPATSTSVVTGPTALSPVASSPATGSLDWPVTARSVQDGRPAPPAAPVAAPGSAVVVRPGDCLWSLAERDLRATGGARPAQAAVAAAWPAWWAANRERVGDDPHLLLPGTELVRP